MADQDPINLTLDDWIATFDRSDADIDAGDIVSGETVIAELRASIARMEAKQRDKEDRRSAAPRSAGKPRASRSTSPPL